MLIRVGPKAWLDHLKKLVVQGDLLKLADSKQSDLKWRSAMYTLPGRVLSVDINASIDRGARGWLTSFAPKVRFSKNCIILANYYSVHTF